MASTLLARRQDKAYNPHMRRGVGMFVLMGVFVACGGTSKREEGDRSSGTGAGTAGTSGSGPVGNGGDSANGGTGGAATALGGAMSMGVGGSGATGPGASGGRSSALGGTAGTVPEETAGEVNAGGSNGTGAKGGTGGGTPAQGGTSGQAGMPPTTITSCSDDFPFLGTWEGSVLDFYFQPLQSLKLELRENDEHDIVGTFVYGDGELPPPPESGDEPWPPGLFDNSGDMLFLGEGPKPIPGFEYTVVRGAGCDKTFRFGIATTEPWDAWCALQEPLLGPDGTYGCVIKGGGASSDQATCTTQDNSGSVLGTYPTWRCEMCGVFDGSGLCTCDENHCYARKDATLTFDFGLSSGGDTQILSGKDPECGDCTARLEKQ
jgi:hypothetical protein